MRVPQPLPDALPDGTKCRQWCAFLGYIVCMYLCIYHLFICMYVCIS